MSLREEMWKYEQITGESAEHVPIIKLGAFLDGYEMGLKALEQQPCEDCISRQAVLEHICENKECYKEDCKGRTLKRCPDLQWVLDLPSVTPERPKGKWITWKEAGNYIPSETRFECSVCHDAAQTLCNGLDLLSPYCPNCGSYNGGNDNGDE